MDFSSFSEENFDVKAWVNAALASGRSSQDSLEQHAQTLVIKLQLLYLELSNSIEEISAQAMVSVPKSIREIEKIRKEAAELKKKLDWFTDHLSKVEANTVDSLKLLSELDKVKIRMESVSNALKDAEKLTKLSDNIDAVFASNNFQQIADRLYQMQISMMALKDVKEFQNQQKNLEKLQDRLDGMTRPHLLQAFNQHDTDASLLFYDIFSKINRTSQLLDYYYRCRQLPVEQHWSSFDKQFVSSNPSSPRKMEINFASFKENPFAKWLPTFYDEVLLLTNNELNWSQRVFPKELNVIPNLIVQTLTSVIPQFRKRIETYVLSENNPKAVEDLISIFEITENFARTVSAVANSDPNSVDKVKSAALEPYFQYQTEYSNIEKKQLSKEFEKVKPVKGVFAKTITNIDNSVSRLFLLGDKAIERCLTFTSGSEGEGLMKTLSDIFVEYIQHLFILLQSLREQAHLDVSSNQPADWNFCQGALQLLQIVNKIMSRLGNFDRQLRSHLIQQKSKLIVKSSNGEVTVTAYHLRNFPEKMKKLITFFTNLEDVAFKLLPTPANLLNSFSTNVHGFVFDALFAFFKDKLDTIPNLEVWTTEPQYSPLNLPTFSQAPSTYMTQIGEQLLMLPQRLEPFVNAANEPNALESRGPKISKGKENIPDELEEGFEGSQEVPTSPAETSAEDDFSFHWISAVGRGTVSLYIQKIMEISILSELGTKQLITDIGYLINVLSVLGVPIDANLETVSKYLNAKEKNDFLGATDSEQKIASMIQTKRGFK